MGDVMRHADHGPGIICRPALGHQGLCEPLPEPAPAGPVDFCAAVSQKGAPVTAYIGGRAVLAIPKRDGGFICTQDTGHDGSHASCDGQGHILARWPRSSVERYWRHGDCEGHDHG